jgi:hypothetical protein
LNGQLTALLDGGDWGCPTERQAPHGGADAVALAGLHLAGLNEAAHRSTGGRADPTYRWERLGQPSKELSLVDLPLCLGKIPRD